MAPGPTARPAWRISGRTATARRQLLADQRGDRPDLYALTATDVGHTIRVRRPPATPAAPAPDLAATAAVKPEAPKATKAPEITGTAQQGQTLTEVHGTWENSPTGFTYKWQQCDNAGNNCVPISGSHGPDLRARGRGRRPHDQGRRDGEQRRRLCQFDLKRHGGRESRAAEKHQSAESHGHRAAGPDPHRGPWHMGKQPHRLYLQVAAVRQLGQQLPLRISGATAQTYVPVAGDVGHTIQGRRDGEQRRRLWQFDLERHARCEAGSAESHQSSGNHGHRAAGSDPHRGPRNVGETARPASHTSGCSATARAKAARDLRSNRQTYVPVAGDIGHTIKVEETASNESGSGSATSIATAVVKSERRKPPKRRKSRAPRSRARPSPRSTERGKTARPASPTSGSSATARATPAPRSRAPPRRPTYRWPGTSATRSRSKRPRATKAARAARPRAPRPS